MRLLAHPLVCRQAVDLMDDYLEGRLSRRDRRRLLRHLAGCDACTAFLEQLRVTIAASGTVEPEDVPPDVMDALVDLFRKFHDDH